MSGIEREPSTIPKAIIHRKILDAAATEPDASQEELASAVSGASPRLVERVLETYGDPADENEGTTPMMADGSATAGHGTEISLADTERTESDEDTDPADSESESGFTGTELERSPTEIIDDHEVTAEEGTSENDLADSNQSSAEDERESSSGPSDGETIVVSSHTPPSLDELTAKQRETLRAIASDPTATQAELAAEFDVTPATVSAHVNAVDGFEWSDRATFVAELFDEQPTADDHEMDTATTERDQTMSQQYADDRLDEIETRLTEITERLEPTEPGPTEPFDSELVHKVVHACMESEQITSDEELQIIRSMLE